MKHFKAYELVPESLYNRRGDKAMQLIDSRLQTFLDGLREVLNTPIVINTWKWGGQFSQRGLRTREFYKSDQDYIDALSQHKFGRGVDFDVKDYTAEEVRQWIIEHRDLDWVKPISFLETDVNWCHIDCRYTNESNDLWCWSVKTGDTQVYKR